MSARSILPATFCCLVVLFGPLSTCTAAEEDVMPRVANAKFHYAAVIKADGVRVRSGPGDSYYHTMLLNRGAPVTVVGNQFEWLKIVPPEGSFSYVSKAFVEKTGDKVGRITADTLNVRAGSQMNQLKSTVQCQLVKGSEVLILEEDDAYYRIKPPADAYLFVHESYVDPVKLINETSPTTRPARNEGNVANQLENPEAGPTTRPAEAVAMAPTTQPSQSQQNARAEFDRLEADLRASSAKALDEQPIANLLAGYEKLLQGNHLTGANRHIADLRVRALQMKLRDQEEYLATRKQQAEATEKLSALAAERDEIQRRMGGIIEVYTAVGTLQASTLQVGPATLYRLTDPKTGRSLCYVRSDDPQFVKFIGQFVGVKGQLVSDPQLSLKVVTATGVSSVDQARVALRVAAQVMPPSLLVGRSTETASTGKD